MKEIPISGNHGRGKFALVDDEDYEFLIQWKWYLSGGYSVRREYIGRKNGISHQKMIFMHRIINKTPSGLETDHIDGNTLNNQKKNLRSATKSQNQRNQKKQGRSFSRFKGVTLRKDTKKWRARIKTDFGRIHLGFFKTEEEAASAYNFAAKKFYGVFARLNEWLA